MQPPSSSPAAMGGEAGHGPSGQAGEGSESQERGENHSAQPRGSGRIQVARPGADRQPEEWAPGLGGGLSMGCSF